MIDNIEILEEGLTEIFFARKLVKVKKISPILQLNIPAEEIVKFTKVHTKLANKFKYTSDGKLIILDTKKARDEFIKLLNDDFLCSELTKEYYEVKVKDKLS